MKTFIKDMKINHDRSHQIACVISAITTKEENLVDVKQNESKMHLMPRRIKNHHITSLAILAMLALMTRNSS